jgi:hypothetical protein
MRRSWLAALPTVAHFAVASGCANEPAITGPPAALVVIDEQPVAVGADRAEDGHDRPPVIDVALTADDGRAISRRGIAASEVAGGAVYVDASRRLWWIGPRGDERVLEDEIGGRPVVDEARERVVWVAVRGDAVGELRTREVDGTMRTIAMLPGVFGALRWDGEQIVLVGSANGGVAGVWIATTDGALACVTNCGLRTGRPWGDAYLPPPGDRESIRIDGEQITYVAADGSQRVAAIPTDVAR